jgi:hypothetical protein
VHHRRDHVLVAPVQHRLFRLNSWISASSVQASKRASGHRVRMRWMIAMP